MKEQRSWLALRVAGQPEPAEAEALVRAALGAGCIWGTLEIELFPGRKETLVLARPASGIYISRDALAYLAVRGGRGGQKPQ